MSSEKISISKLRGVAFEASKREYPETPDNWSYDALFLVGGWPDAEPRMSWLPEEGEDVPDKILSQLHGKLAQSGATVSWSGKNCIAILAIDNVVVGEIFDKEKHQIMQVYLFLAEQFTD